MRIVSCPAHLRVAKIEQLNLELEECFRRLSIYELLLAQFAPREFQNALQSPPEELKRKLEAYRAQAA